jgi:capsular polysaccharide biosynthesis protein
MNPFEEKPMEPIDPYHAEDLVPVSRLKESMPELFAPDLESDGDFGLNDWMQTGSESCLVVSEGASYPADPSASFCNIDRELTNQYFPQKTVSYPPLRLSLHHQALVMPAADLTFEGDRAQISEVRDRSDRLIEESLVRMDGLTVKPAAVAEMRKRATTLPGTYLYLNKFWSHYGHFTIETLTAMYARILLAQPGNAITPVFNVAGRIPRFFKPHILHSFEKLGIKMDEILFLSGPVILEKLIVPTPSARIHAGSRSYIHPQQKKVWWQISGGPSEKPTRKLYLSRSRYLYKGITVRPLRNEVRIEKLFRKQGFEIIHPEALTFPDQMRLYSSARVLAGAAGSNLLNAAYAPDGIDLVSLRPKSMMDNTLLRISDIKNLTTHYFITDTGQIQYNTTEGWELDPDELNRFLHQTGIFTKKTFRIGRWF